MQGRSTDDQHDRFLLSDIAPAMRQITFEVQSIAWSQAVTLTMNDGRQRALQAMLEFFPLMSWVAPSAAWRDTDEKRAQALIRQPFGQQFDAELHVRRIEPTPSPLRAEDDISPLRGRSEKKLQVFVQTVGDF